VQFLILDFGSLHPIFFNWGFGVQTIALQGLSEFSFLLKIELRSCAKNKIAHIAIESQRIMQGNCTIFARLCNFSSSLKSNATKDG